jgi:DNA polymerase sigma
MLSLYYIRGLICYIQGLFDAHCHDYKLALGGSFPLQVYLPESDMDVTVLTENDDDLSAVMQIFSCLCQAIKDNEKQNNLPFAVDDAVRKS